MNIEYRYQRYQETSIQRIARLLTQKIGSVAGAHPKTLQAQEAQATVESRAKARAEQRELSKLGAPRQQLRP